MKIASTILGVIGGSSRSKAALQLTDGGFETVRNGVVKHRVLWTEVQRVVAFKSEEVTTDLVSFEISFAASAQPASLLIHEELEGFDVIVARMASLFGFEGWHDKVILPSFAPNLTQLFPRIEMDAPPSQPSPSGGGRG